VSLGPPISDSAVLRSRSFTICLPSALVARNGARCPRGARRRALQALGAATCIAPAQLVSRPFCPTVSSLAFPAPDGACRRTRTLKSAAAVADGHVGRRTTDKSGAGGTWTSPGWRLVCGTRSGGWTARAAACPRRWFRGRSRAAEDTVAMLAQWTDKTFVRQLLGIGWETVGNIIQRVARKGPTDLLDDLIHPVGLTGSACSALGRGPRPSAAGQSCATRRNRHCERRTCLPRNRTSPASVAGVPCPPQPLDQPLHRPPCRQRGARSDRTQ
jgi:hypothetical protein